MAIDPWADTLTYGPQELRLATGAGLMHVAGSLNPRGGIIPGAGAELEVTSNGTPNKSYNVGTGVVIVPDAASSAGGAYIVTVDATTSPAVNIDDGDASQPRTDLATIRVRPGIGWDVFTVKGTAAAGAPVPALPSDGNSYAEVKRISVPSLATRPTTAIQAGDLSPAGRRFTSAAGGIVPVADGERPSSPWDGMAIIERPSGREYRWYAAGAKWRRVVTEDEAGLGILDRRFSTSGASVPAGGIADTGLSTSTLGLKAGQLYEIKARAYISPSGGTALYARMPIATTPAVTLDQVIAGWEPIGTTGSQQVDSEGFYAPSADISLAFKSQVQMSGTSGTTTVGANWLVVKHLGKA